MATAAELTSVSDVKRRNSRCPTEQARRFQVEFFKNATYLCQMFFLFENRVKKKKSVLGLAVVWFFNKI